MQLTEFSTEEKNDYNRFVAGQPSGSFLQSWEWGDWQARLGREIYRFKIIDDSGSTIGTMQLIKMPMFGKKYYLYAPYGPVLAEGDGKVVSGQWSVVSLTQECKNKFPDAIFFRIEPKVGLLPTTHYPLITKSANIQPAKTLIMDLSQTDEQLLAGMHPKTRYNIKVAQKHGVEIKDEFDISVGHGLFFDEAIRLLAETSKRQKYHSYPVSYYSKLMDFFALQKSDVKIHIYKAVYQNQLLASAVMVDFGTTRTFLFGGSSEDNKNVMAPYLLHWQAMLDAKQQGLEHYDWWGIETAKGDTPGFVRFKMGFGGQTLDYQGAYDMIARPAGYRFYKILRSLNQIKNKFL